jgi:hypothetical protein
MALHMIPRPSCIHRVFGDASIAVIDVPFALSAAAECAKLSLRIGGPRYGGLYAFVRRFDCHPQISILDRFRPDFVWPEWAPTLCPILLLALIARA